MGTEERDTPSGKVASPSAPADWLVWLKSKLVDEKTAVLVVLAMGALVFLPFLGTLGLWDPWETHYGEVARAMIARDDYVYPYWESAYFFSKPALTLWLMALGLVVTGAESAPAGEALGSMAEWGVRLPFAMIAILSLWAVYRLGRQLRDRSTGFLAAFVLASSPQFIFIGKQAMVDMPLVGMITTGFALFAAAVFDAEKDATADRKLRILTCLGIGVATIPQLILIGREMKSVADVAAIIGAGLVALGYIAFIALKSTRHQCWLAGFYTAVGLAALAKGPPLAGGLVGATVLLYMLFSLDFRVVIRSRLLFGIPLFLLVATPWYLVLSLFNGRDDEGLTFRERFWVHDNFARIGAGVHGDRGGAGYFVEQLVYAMFPWSATIPVAIGLAARTAHDEPDVQRRRLMLFLLVWAVVGYVTVSVSLTKFHHYIFPALPPLAILVAAWLSWAAEQPAARLRPAVCLLILAVFAVGARDLINEPQNLVNLFTYKYDRDYPREIVVRPYMGVIVGLGALGMLVFYGMREHGRALLSFALMGGLFGAWISHHHFNMLAPHWSQAHLFKTYFQEKRGNEPIYAYQLNWRGETFYSRNRVLQVKERGANERIRQLVDQPGREFIITEQSRFQALKSSLSPEKRDKLEILDRSNNKFYLCMVED